MIAIPITLGCLCVLGTLAIVVLVPRRDRYAVRRRAEPPRAVLPARLTPSPRALPGRPSAASTAVRGYEITDVPWRNPAPGRTERN